MRWIFTLSVLLTASLANADDLLNGNGDFSRFPDGKFPGKWYFQNNATWAPAAGDIAHVQRGEAVISNTRKSKGVIIRYPVELGKINRLLLKSTVRLADLQGGVEGWQTARVLVDFVDKTGKTMPVYNAINLRENIRTDLDVDRLVDVPAGAVKALVSFGFWGGTGTLYVRNVQLLDITARENYAALADQLPQEEKLSSNRSRLLLNGIWRIVPVLPGRAVTGEGFLRVPGLWSSSHSWMRPTLDGLLELQPEANWNAKELCDAEQVRYSKKIAIPGTWRGKTILLSAFRVSTDAEIWLDGKRAGVISWPSGTLDVTPFIVPGKTVELVCNVIAATDREFIEDFTFYDATKQKSKIYNRGLAGSVELLAIPEKPLLDSVFIRTSVRKKRIDFDLELPSLPRTGPLELQFTIREYASRNIAKRFQRRIDLQTRHAQTVTVSEQWENPRLWDFQQPNLYTVEITARKEELRDSLCERFGFREFRIAGREIFLNEKPFHMRPVAPDEMRTGGMKEIVHKVMGDLVNANFNIVELTPHDLGVRGTMLFRSEWCDAADEFGMPLILPVIGFNTLIPWGAFASPDTLAAWEKMVRPDWKRLRNHPSAVMLIAGHNRFPTLIDQNPLALGNGKLMRTVATESYKKLVQSGESLMDILRKMDPTRPAISHHAGAVGDMHTVNMYLNFIPLQEREEYLFRWAKTGDRPFFAVEFGFPITYSLMRGRSCGPGRVATTEPQLTEYCAIYLGDDVYRHELDEYRRAISNSYRGNNVYNSFHGQNFISCNPVFQNLLTLFIRNTLRSWRSWGMSGGVVPWENANGWNSRVDGMEIVIGKRQTGETPVVSTMPKRFYRQYEKSRLLPAGTALVANNAPTLIWIAGKPENFTEKGHHFYGGEMLSKQFAAVNDLRKDAELDLHYQITAGGRKISVGSIVRKLKAGERRFFPCRVSLPEVSKKTDGKIRISGTIDGNAFSDSFPFSIYPPQTANTMQEIAVWDTAENRTLQRLREMGFRATAYRGGKVPARTLIIGEGGLNGQLPDFREIATFVDDGGTLVLLTNSPEIWRNRFGLRVARQVSRYAFRIPTQVNHPVLDGLDDDALHNWRGASLNHPHYRNLNPKDNLTAYPMYGWHVSTTGAVSSGMIEKPHASGLTPLLEGEFDLAWSPLLEKTKGRGNLILCTLDLVNRTERDPAADKILKQLVEYAVQCRPADTRTTSFLGPPGSAAAKLLSAMQLEFRCTTQLPPPAGLLIVAGNSPVPASALKGFVERGGRLLWLAPESLPIGSMHFEKKVFGKLTGLTSEPEFRGISLSDIHLKIDLPGVAASPGTADGLIGFQRLGRGSIVTLQLTPYMLNVSDRPYLKFTRWRLTRLLAQLITNAGGEFLHDRQLLNPRLSNSETKVVTLPKLWKAEFEYKVPSVKNGEYRPEDPGNRGVERNWHKPDFDDSRWHTLRSGEPFQGQGKYFENVNGVIWYRTSVVIPEEWRHDRPILNLGIVDDMDHTYFNGIEIGKTGREVPNYYNTKRQYPIPPDLIQYGGKNHIAVRVFDNFGNGGLVSPSDTIQISLPELKDGKYRYYVDDYDHSWDYGDDPARYFRW